MSDPAPSAESLTRQVQRLAEVQAELADVAAQATPEQVMAAISAALRGGELDAAVGLIGVLARKDPHAADLLVRAIQYRPTT